MNHTRMILTALILIAATLVGFNLPEKSIMPGLVLCAVVSGAIIYYGENLATYNNKKTLNNGPE